VATHRSHMLEDEAEWLQARNQRGISPPRKNFGPPGKMCWTTFKTIGHSSKNLSPS